MISNGLKQKSNRQFFSVCFFALSFLFVSTVSAQSSSSDIFDSLENKWNSLKPVQARTALKRNAPPTESEEGLSGEFHVAFEPPLNQPLDLKGGLSGAKNHPLPGTVIQLIDSVPKTAWIRISNYIFSNLAIKDAIIRAIDRGVVVRIITTDFPSHLPQDDYEGSRARQVQAEVTAAMARSDNPSHDYLICNKRRPKREDDSGGCISTRLNHNKILLLSRVCRYGLNDQGKCQGGSSEKYDDVVVQGSYNYKNAPRKSHETMSAFFGVKALYTAYVSYFNLQRKYSVEPGLPADFKFKKTISFGDNSFLEVNGMPRTRDISTTQKGIESDVFLKPLQEVNCKAESKPVLRVEVAHWSSSNADRIADYLINMKRDGCEVRLLVKNTMPKSTTLFNKLNDNLNVRVVVSNINTKANLHAKFALVENVNTSKNILMFGSMNFTGTSQGHTDEMWNVWRNPSETAFVFYQKSFDGMWEHACALPTSSVRKETSLPVKFKSNYAQTFCSK